MVNDYTFEYSLLDRLKQDCEYFLGAGERCEKHLWAGSVGAQIEKMIELYKKLPVKPEWLTENEIDIYKYVMTHETEKVRIDGVECHTWKIKNGSGTISNLYCFKCPGWDRIAVIGKRAARRVIRGRTDPAVLNTLGKA